MKRRKNAEFAPEWSRTVEADDIAEQVRVYTLTADEAECAALSRRLGVLDVRDLRAEMTACRDRSEHVVHVEGRVEATVVQSCVVTLDPVSTPVSEPFEAWYADPKEALSFARARAEHLRRKGTSDVPLLDEEEDPEPVVDGRIDLGELAAQYLSLAVPAYPRAPGVESPEAAAAPEQPESALRKSPFAALKAWKAQKDKDKGES
ncbi:MAG TPA: DUF177 domain-containing protein [Alphaproteobacteria bacterium]|nr:DUF177 domain-containing protein [Alphaproteobacteria bacterium]